MHISDTRVFLPSLQVLRPGIDNTLSSYMNQKSVDKDLWRRRWFVLTSRALICYENHHVSSYTTSFVCVDRLFFLFAPNMSSHSIHQRDEASGALWLAGYQVSLPDPVSKIGNQFHIIANHH